MGVLTPSRPAARRILGAGLQRPFCSRKDSTSSRGISFPIWQWAQSQHSLRGPTAQIDRERHALAGISSQYNRAVAANVMREYRLPILRDENWTAPPICKSHGLEHRVQAANAQLDSSDELSRFARGDIDLLQLSPIVHVDQAASKNHALGR